MRPLQKLEGDQLRASHPRVHAALSASAGTGKTHVLTARVLRLLLDGVDPSAILCLTFTKAGAAEMAERLHARLARWVRLADSDLAKELRALDEEHGPEKRAEARRLFAQVIEAPGGGLRILTIHAFAQGLLAAFPAEAGLTPGFRPLEGREQQQLVRSTLAELLVRAEETGDLGLLRDVQALSLRLGEAGAEGFLREAARAPEAMAALGPRQGIEARLRHTFGLPLGDIDAMIASHCTDALFDVAAVRAVAESNRAWGAPTGLAICDQITAWLGRGPDERAASLAELALTVLTKSGTPRKASAGLLRAAPDYDSFAGRLIDCCTRLLQMRAQAEMITALAAALRAGQVFAAAYVDAKRVIGVADFDDLISWAEGLLMTPGMGDWVRYKLDQRTDHILVDEAQDTNERQWNIVRALTLEFFSGEGASERRRTIFTVGDFKQAIFGFQGTDPSRFGVARAWFAREARAIGRSFLDLSMDRSFRSAPQVLAFADQVIAELGHAAFGLDGPPNPHEAHHADKAGSVTLWLPFADEAGDEDDEGEEGWLSDAVRRYASRLARQVRSWLDRPFPLAIQGRALRPEDVLILVRSRGALASLLVARLHAEGVPVAGVDRLQLSAPLAVQDLLATARFAVQPLDDLNLAALLVSPLFGWSQDDLHRVAAGRNGNLWPHLRRSADVPPETLAGLQAILAMADFATPHVFFETLLSGALDGRRKLLERLGNEARDPIEELLSAALEFEMRGSPALQSFLDWFARGDVEIVRDPSGPMDAVRVMTVHGSKGLQAPVVILADACANPDRLGPGGRTCDLPLGEDGPTVPIFRPRKEELAEPIAAQVARQDQLDREEHWRLLYVAMTRAEERLYLGGALGPRDRNGPAEQSWYSAGERALSALGATWNPSPLWGRELRFGAVEIGGRPAQRAPEQAAALPDWLRRPAPAEARPPRPLAPSAIGEDDLAQPPAGPAMRAAAERGRLLHQLFERLPAVATERRRSLAHNWLERSAGVADPAQRAALVEDACRIIEHRDFALLFDSDALAEVPLAAVVGDGVVVAGTVDRLLVRDERVLVADFKTGRRVPADAGSIPPAHLRQMAAYRAALRTIFPDRPVEAALIYTAGPTLHALSDALLDLHAPAGG